jgi:hypothetical protein
MMSGSTDCRNRPLPAPARQTRTGTQRLRDPARAAQTAHCDPGESTSRQYCSAIARARRWRAISAEKPRDTVAARTWTDSIGSRQGDHREFETQRRSNLATHALPSAARATQSILVFPLLHPIKPIGLGSRIRPRHAAGALTPSRWLGGTAQRRRSAHSPTLPLCATQLSLNDPTPRHHFWSGWRICTARTTTDTSNVVVAILHSVVHSYAWARTAGGRPRAH